jgi:acyl carrier protein
MTQEEKISELAEIFEVDANELTPERALDTLNWDSMAMLSTIALVKSKFDKKLAGSELRCMRLVKDILNVMD